MAVINPACSACARDLFMRQHPRLKRFLALCGTCHLWFFWTGERVS